MTKCSEPLAIRRRIVQTLFVFLVTSPQRLVSALVPISLLQATNRFPPRTIPSPHIHTTPGSIGHPRYAPFIHLHSTSTSTSSLKASYFFNTPDPRVQAGHSIPPNSKALAQFIRDYASGADTATSSTLIPTTTTPTETFIPATVSDATLKAARDSFLDKSPAELVNNMQQTMPPEYFDPRSFFTPGDPFLPGARNTPAMKAAREHFLQHIGPMFAVVPLVALVAVGVDLIFFQSWEHYRMDDMAQDTGGVPFATLQGGLNRVAVVFLLAISIFCFFELT